MHHTAPVRKLLFLAMLTGSITGYAQNGTRSSIPERKAILVRLASGHDKLVAMKNRKDRTGMTEVQQDVAEVNKHMIYDLTTNFHACPVYFFVDTNMGRVEQQKFDGILLNADMSLMTNPVPDSYYIVYYGHYTLRPSMRGIEPESDTQPTPGQGLVVLNERAQQVDYFYKMGYDELLYTRKKANKPFYYTSKHYDIEYFPFAAMLDKALTSNYTNRRLNGKSKPINKTKDQSKSN